MPYTNRFEFFLIPEQRIFQNGLDGEVDDWAERFKHSLDDVVPSFQACTLSKLEIMPPRKPLARYDAPWETNKIIPSNGPHIWGYEIGNGMEHSSGEVQFVRHLKGLKVRFETHRSVSQEQFDAVLRKYAEQLRNPASQ